MYTKEQTCEVHVIVTKDVSGYSAEAVGYPVFTQGNTYEEVYANIIEALELHFENSKTLADIYIHNFESVSDTDQLTELKNKVKGIACIQKNK